MRFPGNQTKLLEISGMKKLILLKLAGLAILMQPYFAKGQDITQCTYDPASCSCETNNGKIDLMRAEKGSPYIFNNPTTLDQFFWQPCTDFYQAGTTAGAIQQLISGVTYSMGIHSLASSDVQDSCARFTMQTPDNSRSTYVKCVCGSGDNFVFDKEEPSFNYNFIFTSNFCCPSGGSKGGSTSSSLSPGTIMVIAFFSLLLVYILFGTLFQVAVRKAEGRNRVPNVGLWSACPGLVKDGIMFTFTCGRRREYTNM